MSLIDYINESLNNSYEALELIDRSKLSKFEVAKVKHQYDFRLTPDSSISARDSGDKLSIGLQGSQENIYGGKVYSSLSSSQSKSYSMQREYSLKSSIGYTQSIFRKFGLKYNTLALFSAKEREEKLKIEIEEARKDIIMNSISNYYRVVLRREQIEIYTLASKRAEHNYESAKAKQKTGIVSKIDVHRAKLSYLNAQRDKQNSIKDYKNALNDAYFFISSNESEDKFSDSIKKSSYSFSVNFDNVIQARAEWKIFLINEEILNREIYNSYRDLLPDIKVDVKYHTYSQNNQFKDSLKFDNDGWSVSLSSNYSFDTFDEEIAIKKLKISKNRMIQDKKRLYSLLKKEIKELFNDFENIRETLKIQKLREEEASESLKIAQIRYDRGLSSNLDVMDAESNLLNAQISSVGALVRYNSAMFKLARKLNILNIDFVKKVLY